uniref:Uncharacterized protein n=1 Tax=Aegilops tauschii subsp. strangulata TaxID=200361 RepID=A0A453JR59_AEGTS
MLACCCCYLCLPPKRIEMLLCLMLSFADSCTFRYRTGLLEFCCLLLQIVGMENQRYFNLLQNYLGLKICTGLKNNAEISKVLKNPPLL